MYLNKKGDRLGLFTRQCRYSCHLMGLLFYDSKISLGRVFDPFTSRITIQ